MFRQIVFFGLITAASASETLDALVDASANFAAGIQQQLAAVQGEPSPGEFAMRDAMPELTNIATGMEVRPPESRAKKDAVVSGYGDAVADLANAIAFSSMCEWLECYKGGDLAYWKVTEAAGRLWIGWQGQNSGRFSGALISRLTLEFATRQIFV